MASPAARAGIDGVYLCWAVSPPTPVESEPRCLHHRCLARLPPRWCPQWPTENVFSEAMEVSESDDQTCENRSIASLRHFFSLPISHVTKTPTSPCSIVDILVCFCHFPPLPPPWWPVSPKPKMCNSHQRITFHFLEWFDRSAMALEVVQTLLVGGSEFCVIGTEL